MKTDLIGIGRLAALSGLSVSALRFYDSAGILVPASVDPANNYRGYYPSQVGPARIVAHLRRVGMPLAEIRAVLTGPAPTSVLDAYLQRLQDGLDDARRELFTVRALLTPEENTVYNIALSASALRDALADVRFAVSTDPELPMLNGILIDVDGPELRVVASDRHRLAIATVAVDSADSFSALTPTVLVDELIAALAEASGPVAVQVAGLQLTFSFSDKVISGSRLDLEFPDYRRLLPAPGRQQVSFSATALRQAVLAAPIQTKVRDGVEYPVSVLTLDDAGTVSVGSGAGLQIGVNQEFLLQALASGRNEQLTLELDGPIAPLAIRDPQRADSFSMLMPVRLD